MSYIYIPLAHKSEEKRRKYRFLSKSSFIYGAHGIYQEFLRHDSVHRVKKNGKFESYSYCMYLW